MNKETTDALGGVGAKMRALREAKKISLRSLARRVDVTPSLISQIETGKINPSVSSLYAIANALEAPMDAFFGRSVEPGGIHSSRTAGLQQNAPEAPPPAVEQAAAPGDQTHHPAVVRRAARERIVIDGFGGLLVWERLTPGHESHVDFLEIQYEPGASSAQNLMRHSGREYGLVLEGELTVNLGFEEFVLGQGDSIAYESTLPHRLTNRGNTLARAVWAVVNREPSRGATD